MANIRKVLTSRQQIDILKKIIPIQCTLRILNEANLKNELIRKGFTNTEIDTALSELKSEGIIQEV